MTKQEILNAAIEQVREYGFPVEVKFGVTIINIKINSAGQISIQTATAE